MIAAALCKQNKPGSAVIAEDLMVIAKTIVVLLAYFQGIIMTLQHHQVYIRLRKTRLRPAYAQFVEINTVAKGKSLALADLIILFLDARSKYGKGFYSKVIPWLEESIIPLRDSLTKRPPIGTLVDEEQQILDKIWNENGR
jgi:hypothetical protein